MRQSAHVGFTDLLGWAHVADVETVFTSPGSGITTNALGVKNFLSRRHEFVARIHACVRGIAVATQLNSLYLRDLLG
ncbi:hypothetical protein A5681_08315 [Mycobacterium scrofulaceum]|nr:hypothetical protein A5681_08315 [Mycobacterium scrofulaceum]